MSKVLIIGAGGVANVVAKKCAQNSADLLRAPDRHAHQVACRQDRLGDLEHPGAHRQGGRRPRLGSGRDHPRLQTRALVMNIALPYQDLAIMDACLETGVDYLDTANYEPKDVAKFEYSWQWAYQERFQKAGIMALLGSGFDPGQTNVYTAWLKKHHFDRMDTLDIVDCNNGDHGKAFATNFNPEINIREITQNGRYWQDGKWIETAPLEIKADIAYPEVAVRGSYVLFHEELESLVKNFPELKRARFWMTFGDNYIKHLTVLQNVGMTRIDPVRFQGQDIIPLEFLKALLPAPDSLGDNYSGLTCIGCQVVGEKDGKPKTGFVYNVCDHAKCFSETGGQAISYTTAVPAMLGGALMLRGTWKKAGVVNMEEMDPDPFMAEIGQWGLPWTYLEGDAAKLV
jgi:saccharopine dehydrogenase (NAD+, L-lysine-forming)